LGNGIAPFLHVIRSRSILPALCLAFILASSGARAGPVAARAAPVIEAESYLLYDHNSGEVLAQKNIDQQVAPGELVRLMVAFAVFDAMANGKLKPDATVPIRPATRNTPAPRLFAPLHAPIAAQTLVRALVIGGANDASTALAQAIDGNVPAFLARMNGWARQLGMDHTRFTDLTGVDRTRQTTTARDLQILVRSLIRRFPQEYALFHERQIGYQGLTLYNRNALLWQDKQVDGVAAARVAGKARHLIASAVHDKMRLTAIVLGAPGERSRVYGARQLLEFGFAHFETRLLYRSDTPAVRVRVWMGDRDTVPVGTAQNLYLTLRRGSFDQVRARLRIDSIPEAPVEAGTRLGTLQLTLGDRDLGRWPLVALQTVGTGGLLRRNWDRLQQWLDGDDSKPSELTNEHAGHQEGLPER
jgi:D-alanyl-D-alanine carboxypeptidase (penicillin-binding protein 5/6)